MSDTYSAPFKLTNQSSHTFSPEEVGMRDRERPEFYVNRLSLHMDGNIRSDLELLGEGIDGALYLCVSP